MTKKQLLVGLVSVALLALGAAVVLEPTVLFETVPELQEILAAIDPSVALLALVVVLALSALVRGLVGRSWAQRPPSLDRGLSHDSFLSGRDRRTVGASLDAQVERAMDYDGIARESREGARATVEAELRSLAIAHYAQQTGCPPAEAEAAIDRGEWTDDRRAAAFLAGEEGPTTPLTFWLLDLLTGRDSFEQGVRRTIETIRTDQTAKQRGSA